METTMHPKPGKAPSRAQSSAISRATTRRWMSLVPSVHNRIAISTGPFAQRPAPPTANPTEIFLLHLCDQFLQAECFGPSDNEIGDQLLMGNIEGGLAAVRVEGDQALART